MLKILIFSTLFFLVRCSSDSDKIDHARFEIEQGNFSSARRYLETVPTNSQQFKTADSILKAIENR